MKSQDDRRKFLDAIVLAGGRSRRMGQDKALLTYKGQPLLKTVCEVAASCAHKTYLVTPWEERYAQLDLPVQLVPEPRPEAGESPPGPLAGFALGLQQVQAEWVLLLACDLPLLDTASLLEGKRLLVGRSPETQAFLHRHPKGWEPLCGFYRSSCLDSLQAALSAGTRSFQQWLSHQAVEEWQGANPDMFVNCNTPQDWKQAIAPQGIERDRDKDGDS